MDKKCKKRKMLSTKIRCAYSGKAIGNRKAILVEYIKEYLAKNNILVSNIKFVIISLFLIALMSPLCLAFDSQYSFNLESRINIVMTVLFIVGASILAFIPKTRMLSAFLFVIIGIFLLFNNLNPILSGIIIIIGVIIIFIK